MISKKIRDYMINCQDKDGSFKDPYYNIKRNRVAAEVGRGLLLLGDKEAGLKALNWILRRQNTNGSWNEIHPDLNEESTLVTSICGKSMLDAYKITRQEKFLASSKKAAAYVLSKEFSPGFFIKSYKHYADVLNVNATVLAFINSIGKELKNKKMLEAGKRCVFNIVRHQFKNGAYPYSTPVQSYPYEYKLNIPDIHYQGTTMFYLMSSGEKNDKYLSISLKKAADWFSKTINSRGFKWNNSYLMFSHKVSAAYGFGAYCFKNAGFNKEYKFCINSLKNIQNKNGSFNRYEKRLSLFSLIKGLFSELFGDESIGLNYDFLTRLKRMKERAKRELFDCFFKNEESMIYTSQIFDCLVSGDINE